jgi:hypothetical protein
MKTWLTRKLVEPCACHSGRAYRECCYRRETIYFVVGVAAAAALFGAHQWPALLAIVPVLLIAAVAAKVHFDRLRRSQLKQSEAEQSAAPLPRAPQTGHSEGAR